MNTQLIAFLAVALCCCLVVIVVMAFALVEYARTLNRLASRCESAPRYTRLDVDRDWEQKLLENLRDYELEAAKDMEKK